MIGYPIGTAKGANQACAQFCALFGVNPKYVFIENELFDWDKLYAAVEPALKIIAYDIWARLPTDQKFVPSPLNDLDVRKKP